MGGFCALCHVESHGPLSYEFSEIEGERTFPMSVEGRADMLSWLESNL